MIDKRDRRDKRRFGHAECDNHQPFVKMEKVPEFWGYRCPECGNEMDELVRLYHLESLRCNSG